MDYIWVYSWMLPHFMYEPMILFRHMLIVSWIFDPKISPFNVYTRGGVDMQPSTDPLHTSHPSVERVRWHGLHDEWRLRSPSRAWPRCVQLPLNLSTSHPAYSKLAAVAFKSWMLDTVGCGIWSGKAAHQEEKEHCVSKTTRKTTGNHLALFFPR